MILFVAPLEMFLGELAGGLDLIAFAIALVSLESLLAFLVNESRHQTPLLDLSVFGDKKSVLPIISITLLIISSFALFIPAPSTSRELWLTPSKVGTVFLIVPVIMTMTFGSPLGDRIYDKYHYRIQLRHCDAYCWPYL